MLRHFGTLFLSMFESAADAAIRDGLNTARLNLITFQICGRELHLEVDPHEDIVKMVFWTTEWRILMTFFNYFGPKCTLLMESFKGDRGQFDNDIILLKMMIENKFEVHD